MKIRYLLLVVLGSLTLAAHATHFSGGEIYWECIGPDQFRIRLVVYRDCAGVNVQPTQTLQFTSPCGNRSLVVSTPGGTEISQLCDIELPNSTCNGGTLPGIQQYIYTGIITLPPCDSWHISWTNIYRNNAIVNLTNPGTRETYIESVLNNLAAPCNNSPTFTNVAIPYVCMGYPITYSYGAVDVEGDSLSYALIGARMAGGVAIPYVPPNSGLVPIPGLTLDPATGQINFTLNQIGNWVVVVQVTQYDANGNVTGTILRDMQFVAYPCTNDPPDPTTGVINSMTGAAVQTGPRAIEVCESGDFCFSFTISDPNTNNVLVPTTNVGQNLPGATFTYTGTNPITATVCWTAAQGTSGFFPFIVTVSDGACPIPAFQTYIYAIQVLPGAHINVVVVDETCAGNGDGSVTANVIAGTAPFQYDWGILPFNTPSITVGAGTYSVQVTDAHGCVSAPGTGVVGALEQPGQALAGPDLVACLGDLPVTLNGQVVNATGGTWSGGNGTFGGNWPSITYQPSLAEIQAGGLDLTLTTTGQVHCPAAQDVLHLTLSNTFLNAAINATDATCAGTPTGTVSVVPNGAGLSYSWAGLPGANGPSIAQAAPGTYTVTVTDGLGCDTTLSITVGAPPALALASLSATDESCAGLGDGTAQIAVNGGTAPYQVSWSTGDTTLSIQAGAGSYTVSVTDANGCAPVGGTVTINAVAQPPVAFAGPDQVACLDQFPLNLQGTVQHATGGVWSGGSGTFLGTGLQVQYMPSASEVQSGGVALVLTTTGSGPCAAATDTVVVIISKSFLNAQVSGTDASCQNGADGSALFSPAQPSFSYVWSTNAGAQTTNPAVGLPAGTYTLTVTDTLGCDTTMNVTIAAPPAVVATIQQSADPLCASGATGWALGQAAGGTPGYAFTWSGNGINQSGPSATGLPAGTYTLVVTDANGCQGSAPVTLADPPPVVVVAQVPDTVCVNAPVILTAQASGGTGQHLISWAGIGTGSPLTHAFPGSQVVTVTAMDAQGCVSAPLNFPVTVLDLSQATLLATGDITVCPGGSATVGATLSGYPGSYTLSWPQLGQVGPGPFTVPVTGNITLQVIATDGCGQQLQDDVVLLLQTPPQVVLPPVFAEGCAPLTVHFPDTLVSGQLTYLWSLGDGTTTVTPAPIHTYGPGTYAVSLTVSTPLGCTATAASPGLVIAHAGPDAAFSASTYDTDADNALIAFSDASSGSLVTHAWDFGDGTGSAQQNPSHQYQGVGTFTVSLWVQDINGCTDSTWATITITPVHDITIPNAFTPGSQGGGGFYDPLDLSNDVFYPFVRFVKDYQMRIYNRWGELVFESDDLMRGWDGHYRGQLSPQDVYVYQVWVRFVDGKEIKKIGDLTLFR